MRVTSSPTTPEDRIIGHAPAISGIRDMIGRIADTPGNVLICGERGTGKELIARTVHRVGRTASGPFVAVDCNTLTDALIGGAWPPGSMSGLQQTEERNLLDAAAGGTLFLDEVGNLSPSCQSTLLRAIEDRIAHRLPESRTAPPPPRIIASTNWDLEEAVGSGDFREDLYYRLSVIRLTVPPLRERKEDIPDLVRHFAARCSAEMGRPAPEFEQAALDAMIQHDWPGNVRELESVVQRAVIFATDRPVRVEDLTLGGSRMPTTGPYSADLRHALRDFERQHIARVLASFGYNKVATARALGIGLSSLYRKLEELGLSTSTHHPRGHGNPPVHSEESASETGDPT